MFPTLWMSVLWATEKRAPTATSVPATVMELRTGRHQPAHGGEQGSTWSVLSPPPAPWGGSSVLAAMGWQVGCTASDLHFFRPIFMSDWWGWWPHVDMGRRGLLSGFARLTMTRGLLNKTVSPFTCGICLFDSIPEKHNWKKTHRVSQGHGWQREHCKGGSPGDVGCWGWAPQISAPQGCSCPAPSQAHSTVAMSHNSITSPTSPHGTGMGHSYGRCPHLSPPVQWVQCPGIPYPHCPNVGSQHLCASPHSTFSPHFLVFGRGN